MVQGGEALTERITFAEAWLQRARRQIREGDLSRGALTLMLAEAELHWAREAGLAEATQASLAHSRPARTRRQAAIAGVGAAALLATAVLLFAQRPVRPLPAPEASMMPPIVRLTGGTGDFLKLVMVPEPVAERTVVERTVVERTVERPVITRVPVILAPQERRSLPAQVAAQPAWPSQASVATAPASPATAPALMPTPQPASAPVLLSEADVIDLVLAAERTLRQSP